MKSEKFSDALESYSQAIKLDGKNAVYFCNRWVLQWQLLTTVTGLYYCACDKYELLQQMCITVTVIVCITVTDRCVLL